MLHIYENLVNRFVTGKYLNYLKFLIPWFKNDSIADALMKYFKKYNNNEIVLNCDLANSSLNSVGGELEKYFIVFFM